MKEPAEPAVRGRLLSSGEDGVSVGQARGNPRAQPHAIPSLPSLSPLLGKRTPWGFPQHLASLPHMIVGGLSLSRAHQTWAP